MEICQSAMGGQGATRQLQKWNQIWAAIWEDWEEETNHSWRSDMEVEGLGWGGAGKNEKGEGGSGVVNDGGSEMRYELKLRRMESERWREELGWVHAPFHTEAQWRNPERSADVEVRPAFT